MLWEIEIHPAAAEVDREGERVRQDCQALGAGTVNRVRTARSFLLETEAAEDRIRAIALPLLVDPVAETAELRTLGSHAPRPAVPESQRLLNVLFKPGVTDNVAQSARAALVEQGLPVQAAATCRKYWLNADAAENDLNRVATKILSNDAIEQYVWGPLQQDSLALGGQYRFELRRVAIRGMDDAALQNLSKTGQLYLSLEEMRTIRDHFQELQRDPTDVELETLAQTWSEHCSHKTLAGRIRYSDGGQEILFENMLKETIFAATRQIRENLGYMDWCVSVFSDNAGVVTFDEKHHVCFKVETHNHPSALEPYGGANTGLGGVIRDPLGTGLGAKPVCNTNVFCFAPPDISYDELPPGVLHPRVVMEGVVSGVRDYGNRMGIPTVNGAVYFDRRYLGNPLVYCGNVGMIPVDKCDKRMQPGDLIVAVGGRTGRDGIHGATFSSAELTEESETLSGGAVQIGNAITEKMMMDVILQARDAGLYSSITDCGAGGFSSAVGEMGEKTGAEVWLDKCPLKYAGLSYTEIWISEAQERMVLAVPPQHWEAFHRLCAAEGVEATIFGEFTNSRRLVLKYNGETVGDLSMEFLHDGRPPVIREATFQPSEPTPLTVPQKESYTQDLHDILGSLNVASKEWIIRQYDHEVQAGSVVKPLVGVRQDGPSDAAVIRPDLSSNRGLAISCGMNPHYGDLDPYWMAASAIDEAIRNCIAVGADPGKIAILDNFCWGNTERPETLGTLVRAALACRDFAIRFQTPFISGKDSLNNNFSFQNAAGEKETVTIPSSLLISALGQLEDVTNAVTMDLKAPGNLLLLAGSTADELGGSHFALVNRLAGGHVPRVDAAASLAVFRAVHRAISAELIASCHDLSEGGLAVALAEMSFAGELGATVNLTALEQATTLPAATLLFSESNSRFLLEVSPDRLEAVQAIFGAVPLVELGRVRSADEIQVVDAENRTLIDAAWQELKRAWQAPLAWS